jgi:hypothetical protein
MSVRKHDMSQWYGYTKRCDTLEQAMECAQHDLKRTPLVSIYPPGKACHAWMLIAFMPASAATN